MLNLLNAVLLPALLKALGAIVAAMVTAAAAAYRRKVRNDMIADALTFVTTLAGDAVLAAADTVRDLKNPLKPGEWRADVEGRAIADAVVAKIMENGGGAINTLLHGIAGGDVLKLKEQLHGIVEARVEALRQTAKPAALLTANVVASAGGEDPDTVTRAAVTAALKTDTGDRPTPTPSAR